VLDVWMCVVCICVLCIRVGYTCFEGGSALQVVLLHAWAVPLRRMHWVGPCQTKHRTVQSWAFVKRVCCCECADALDIERASLFESWQSVVLV